MGGAVALAALGFAFRGRIASILKSKPENIVPEAKAAKAAPDAKVPANAAADLTKLKNLAKDEMRAKPFADDCYESLYRISIGKSKAVDVVFRDWNARIHYLSDSGKHANLKKYWNTLWQDTSKTKQEKASEFVKSLHEWGITRDSAKEFVADAKTGLKYFTDEPVVEGVTRLKTELACWVLDNERILSKGIAEII